MLLAGLIDYHIHTKLCGHARGEVEDYLEQARNVGLLEVGFSDHFPLLDRDGTGLTMGLEDLALYYERIAALRRENPGISVKVGIEVDYIPGLEKRTEELLSLYGFDYVIGSVHHIGDLDFSNSENRALVNLMDFDRLYKDYSSLVRECVQTKLFDILAHPDLIKKYGHSPSFSQMPYFEDTVSELARAGMSVEINTSGLRKPVKEMFPSADFLELCSKEGVPLTLASDAHKPSEVGLGLDEAARLARRCGYSESVRFSRRKIVERVKLPC